MNEFWNETREKKLDYYLYPLTVTQYFGFGISAWRNMFAEQFFNDWIQMRNILCCGSKKVANSAKMRAQLYLAVDVRVGGV